MRILVVEDYPPLRLAVVEALRLHDHAVDAAGDGEEARWFAQANRYDLIILDLMLPGIDGLGLLREWRGRGDGTHVLVITARDAIEDRVAGLDGGADDYLVKPFPMPELLARVRALLRRGYQTKNPLVTVGDLEIDTVRRSARRGGRDLGLTPREYALLVYLASRQGEVVTRDEIRERLYDFDRDPSSNVINVYIGYLRRKLGDEPHPLLHTVRGQGYLLAEGPAP
jgi:DNA-binding response OmpR family regulator